MEKSMKTVIAKKSPSKRGCRILSKVTVKDDSPVVSLADAAKEHGIRITKEDIVTIDSIMNILDAGTPEVVLSYSKDKDRVEVTGNYKSVSCTNVKVKKISNKGNMCDNIADTKLHIQCSHWMFPCPDYKYENIKRNLEKSICAILDIGTCEVESFQSGIIDYTSVEEKK